jgi:hypothetical protein
MQNLMNIDQFLFNQCEETLRFEKWWRSLPCADMEMGHGDWQDQFNLWLDSEAEQNQTPE